MLVVLQKIKTMEFLQKCIPVTCLIQLIFEYCPYFLEELHFIEDDDSIGYKCIIRDPKGILITFQLTMPGEQRCCLGWNKVAPLWYSDYWQRNISAYHLDHTDLYQIICRISPNSHLSFDWWNKMYPFFILQQDSNIDSGHIDFIFETDKDIVELCFDACEWGTHTLLLKAEENTKIHLFKFPLAPSLPPSLT